MNDDDTVSDWLLFAGMILVLPVALFLGALAWVWDRCCGAYEWMTE